MMHGQCPMHKYSTLKYGHDAYIGYSETIFKLRHHCAGLGIGQFDHVEHILYYDNRIFPREPDIPWGEKHSYGEGERLRDILWHLIQDPGRGPRQLKTLTLLLDMDNNKWLQGSEGGRMLESYWSGIWENWTFHRSKGPNYSPSVQLFLERDINMSRKISETWDMRTPGVRRYGGRSI